MRHVAEGDLVLVTWVPRDAARAKALPVRATLQVSDGVAQSENVFTWANYTLCDEQYVVKADPRTPRDVTSIIGCAVMTGAGAVIHTAVVKRGQSVAIFGVGGVGLSAVVGARMAGANPIIAVDLDEAKLEFAHRFGATHMINAGKVDPIAAIHALTPRKGEFTILRTPVSGVDFAFDCIGIKKTMEQIVPACRSGQFGVHAGGTAVLVGVPGTPVELNAMDMLLNEKTIHRQHRRIVRARSRLPDLPRLAQERRSRSRRDGHRALPARRHQRSDHRARGRQNQRPRDTRVRTLISSRS